MSRPASRRPSFRRASALLTVVIFAFALTAICGVMLSAVTFENRMARRASANAELKLATDTVLNYAASQVTTNPNLANASPSRVATPPAALFSSGSSALSLVMPERAEVRVTPLSRQLNPAADGPKYFIDPAAPINARDKLANQYVYRDLGLIVSKASVRAPGGGDPIDEYALLVLERRLVHIFNYLAFFDVAKFRISNPGSALVLDGPVQANKGVLFSNYAANTNVVSMESTVHTPGTFAFAGSTRAGVFKITDGTTTGSGAKRMVDLFNPATGTLRQSGDDLDAAGNVIGDSFKLFMLNDTKGFLKTGEVGESTVVLDGLNYVDDAAAAIPDTYKISKNRRVDPPNPTLRNSTEPQYAAARAAEEVKTAYRASLYTYVETDGSVTVFTNQANAQSYKGAADKAAWKAANTAAYLAADETGNFVAMPYVERYNTGGADYVSAAKNTDLARGAMFDAQQKATVAMVDVDLGRLKTRLDTGGLRLANGATWNAAGPQGWNGVFYVDVQNPATRPAAPVKDKVTGQYLDATTKRPSATVTAATALKTAALPSLNITGTAKSWQDGSAIADTTGLTAVRIKNAQTVPGALIGDSTGFTLATNTATYTVGSVNADGNLNTGTTSLQDDQANPRAATTKLPVSILSDKNVVLSDDFSNPAYDLDLYVPKPASYPPGMNATNWPFTGPASSSSTYRLAGSGNGHYQYQRDPGNRTTGNRVMELNAAFIVGDDDNSNFGIHTMLSYLQPFHSNNDTLRMRGSIIGIYKSRYFTGAAGSFNDYYVAPKRTFGYSSLFKAGIMPPAAPTISNYRRMSQLVITKADYEALKALPATVDDWLAYLGARY